jgi:hypothetical protein
LAGQVCVRALFTVSPVAERLVPQARVVGREL